MSTETEYYAYMFDDSVESGRIKVEVVIEYDKVVLKSEKDRKTMYLKDMVIEKGGSNKSLYFYKSLVNEKLIFFSDDKKIFQALKALGGESLEPAIKDLKKEVKKQFSISMLLGIVFLAVLVLIPVGLYFAYPSLISSAVSAVPIEVDQKIGDVAHAQYISQAVLVTDKKVTVALDVVLERLKPHIEDYPYDFKFFVIDNNDVNAFALPGGYIVVHTGLLLKAESAEELAGVLAHEISHVVERHSVERIVSSLGVIVIAEVLIGDISGLLEMVVQGAEVLSMSQFSQSQESEADRAGFLILKKAKISHKGFISFFERMQKMRQEKAGDLEGLEEIMGFVSSHPSDENRIKNIQEMYKEHPYIDRPIDMNWDEYKVDLKNILLGGKE